MSYVIVGIAALAVAFFAVVIVTAVCERQRLSGDVEPACEPFPYPPLPYWLATRDAALRLGMIHSGDFATKRDTSTVKGLQSMWVTQDRWVICAIIGGSFVGITLKKTVLRSRLENGLVIESTDSPGVGDISNLVDRAVLVNAGLEELMTFHALRIAKSGSIPTPFKGDSAILSYEQVDLDKGSRMVELKLARWVGPQRDSIRLTFRGALTLVIADYLGDMRKLSRQKNRIDLPRAGS